MGINAIPGDLLSIVGRVFEVGFGKNSNFWTIPTKKIKISILANCSPKQWRGPIENGIT